jgi:hypothetical protein
MDNFTVTLLGIIVNSKKSIVGYLGSLTFLAVNHTQTGSECDRSNKSSLEFWDHDFQSKENSIGFATMANVDIDFSIMVKMKYFIFSSKMYVKHRAS